MNVNDITARRAEIVKMDGFDGTDLLPLYEDVLDSIAQCADPHCPHKAQAHAALPGSRMLTQAQAKSLLAALEKKGLA